MSENIKAATLVEISTVKVDKTLPQNQRYAEFKRQIKDINNYKSGALTVKAVYSSNGESLEDCLRGMMA